MTALAKTVAKPADRLVQHRASDNLKVRYLDLTSDTGTYTSGGIAVTAAEVGLKHITFVATSGGVATGGTAGATANAIGITYATDGTSFTVWVYESGGSAAPLAQKDNTEAMIANWIVRLKIEGF